MILSEVFIGDSIGFGINLSEVKGLWVELCELLGGDGNGEDGSFDDVLLWAFGFDFELGQIEVFDGSGNEIFALFLPRLNEHYLSRCLRIKACSN